MESAPEPDATEQPPAPPPIVVDVNEPPSMVDLLVARGATVERRRLAPADYVVGPIALERKTISDFHGSLIQKRLFEQLTRLKETYPPPVGLLLEGDLSEVESFAEPRSFWGALLAVAVDLDVRVLPTPSRAGTADLLATLALRLARERNGRGTDVRFKPRMLGPEVEQRFVVQGLPGIGDRVSHNLLERFGSLRRLFAASERELLRVPGVGKKRAAEIGELLDRPYEGAQRRLAGDEED